MYSHVQMWVLDHKEGWAMKNWCFWIVLLARTLESPLDGMEIKPVTPKGNQPWIVIGRTDAEAEALILWPPGAKSQLTGKDPDAGKGWRWKEKRAAEDEMVRQNHQLTGPEFDQTLGYSEGQGRLTGCSPWGCKESDTMKRLNSSNREKGWKEDVEDPPTWSFRWSVSLPA